MSSFLVKTKCYHQGRLYEEGEVVELYGEAPVHFESLDKPMETVPSENKLKEKERPLGVKTGPVLPPVEYEGTPEKGNFPAEEREKLELQAKEIGVRGCLAKMKDETLKKKVEELLPTEVK